MEAGKPQACEFLSRHPLWYLYGKEEKRFGSFFLDANGANMLAFRNIASWITPELYLRIKPQRNKGAQENLLEEGAGKVIVPHDFETMVTLLLFYSNICLVFLSC